MKGKLVTLGVLIVILVGSVTLVRLSPWDKEKQETNVPPIESHDQKIASAIANQKPSDPMAVNTETGDQLTEDEAIATYDEGIKNEGHESEEIKQKGIDGIQAPNPFGNELINRGKVNDQKAQEYLLRMASDKNEITRERIGWLSYAVSIDKQELKHKAVYKEILKRWQDEDFSQLKSDKQKILDLQE